MRLLLVEDELDILDFLKRSLEEAGYQVEAASDGKTAKRLAIDGAFDILIVDLGLPDQDGITLILHLRQLGVRAPVLILSARRSLDDRVRGLEQGGDDYLTKPFALAELLARLRNLLKRNNPPGNEATRLRVLDLELDLLRREASRSGQMLQLTPQEFVLLEYFCRNAGRVVTRSMILDQVWGMRIHPDTNIVDVHIYRLRGKVDGNGQQPLIRTLRGVGYVLKDRFGRPWPSPLEPCSSSSFSNGLSSTIFSGEAMLGFRERLRFWEMWQNAHLRTPYTVVLFGTLQNWPVGKSRINCRRRANQMTLCSSYKGAAMTHFSYGLEQEPARTL
jgi:two-component system copper resistance phosphate regulon response regulator CusR